MYAAFFIDEHTRYIWVEPLKAKSEAASAFWRVVAHFDATVGTPTDDQGKPLERPRVLHLRTDHEGGLMSYGFAAFREDKGIHLSLSPPHDHDLNPIAERTIGVIDTLATAIADQCKAPIGYWPWLLAHAVEVHNCAAAGSVGSSTADVHASAFERLTLTKPKVMDLCTVGARAVVLKAPTDQRRATLSGPGEEAIFLGRSTGYLNPTRAKSASAYDVVVNGKMREVSAVYIDEEHIPWRRENARFPLTPTSKAASPPASTPVAPTVTPGVATGAGGNSGLTLLSLFSGP